jgi:type IV pilus assembly protein PilF
MALFRVHGARSADSLLLMVVMLGFGLSGCQHNTPLSSGKSTTQAAAANMQLAIEYIKLGQLASSREYIERALKEDPGNPNVQATAGLVYERLNEMSKAEHAYSRALRLGNDDPNIQNTYAGFLCRTGKVPAGEKLFAEVARNPLYQTPEVALVNAGVCVGDSGDAVDAERYFQRALVIHPNLPEALLQLGTLAFDRGDAAQAVDYVQQYLAGNAATPEVLWLGFRAERKLGDKSAAAGFARRVQTEFPSSQQAQMMRSGVDR